MSGFLLAPYRSALLHRELVKALVVREVHTTFRSSMLGAAWLVLQPLLSLLVYAAVFGGILGNGSMTFVCDLFAGMIVYGAFADTASRAPHLVLARPNYVTKVAFPLEVLPWPLAAQAGLTALISTVILVLLYWTTVATPAWTALLLPLVLTPALLFGLALGWALAAFGVYVRDTVDIVRVALQLLFFLCPIVWTLDQIGSEVVLALVMCNPLAVVIEAMRAALTGSVTAVDGVPVLAAPTLAALLAATTVVALLLVSIAYRFFARLRGGFADVL